MIFDGNFLLQHWKNNQFNKLKKSLLKNIKNLDLTEGIILSLKKGSKEPISIISYFSSVFPYNTAYEGHIVILNNNKEKFIGILSILASLITFLKQTSKKNIILKFDLPSLNVMLIFLDLGFELINFSSKEIRYVVLHRKFDDNFYKKINNNLPIITSKDYYKVFSKDYETNYSLQKLINNNLKFSNTHFIILCKWLNIDKNDFQNSIFTMNNITRIQKNYINYFYIKNKNYFYFIANTETNIGIMFFTANFLKRPYLRTLKEKLLKLKLKKVYLSNNYSHIEGMLYLLNFSPTNYSKNSLTNNLIGWEK